MFAFSFAPPAAIFRVRFHSPKGHKKQTTKSTKNCTPKSAQMEMEMFAPPAAIFRHSQVNDPSRREETASSLHNAWSRSEAIEKEETIL